MRWGLSDSIKSKVDAASSTQSVTNRQRAKAEDSPCCGPDIATRTGGETNQSQSKTPRGIRSRHQNQRRSRWSAAMKKPKKKAQADMRRSNNQSRRPRMQTSMEAKKTERGGGSYSPACRMSKGKARTFTARTTEH